MLYTVYYTMSKISGIYIIKNLKNNRLYIGSTICFKNRKAEHIRKIRNKNHANKFMQNDFLKCGIEYFSFEILEIVKDVDLLFEREKEYIEKYYDNQIMCYNICKDARGTRGIKMPEEIKIKISKKLKGRKIHKNTHKRLLDKTRNPFSISGSIHPKHGKKLKQSSKDKIREKLKNHKRTKKHCENISKALKGKSLKKETIDKLKDGRRSGIKNSNSKMVAQYSLDGKLIKIWNYMKEASVATNTKLSSISQCCNNKRKTANNYIWRFFILC